MSDSRRSDERRLRRVHARILRNYKRWFERSNRLYTLFERGLSKNCGVTDFHGFGPLHRQRNHLERRLGVRREGW